MSTPAFEQSELLRELGLEHGFGTRASQEVQLPDLSQVSQVHGTTLLRAPELAPQAEADALWTTRAGQAVAVRTADCVPVLIVDSERRAVCAVHAGWKGSAAGIASSVVRALCTELEAPPSRLFAAIGPHIGACCYEVDDPVRRRISDASVFSATVPGHYMLDLFALNRAQLLEAGLRPERIERVGGCTSCEAERYFSYRRDGSAGRMLHYVRMWFS